MSSNRRSGRKDNDPKEMKSHMAEKSSTDSELDDDNNITEFQPEKSAKEIDNPPESSSKVYERPTSLVGVTSCETGAFKLKGPPPVVKISKHSSSNPVKSKVESESSGRSTRSTGAIPKKRQSQKRGQSSAEEGDTSRKGSSELSSEESSDAQHLLVPEEKSHKSGHFSAANVLKKVLSRFSPKKNPGSAQGKGRVTRSKKGPCTTIEEEKAKEEDEKSGSGSKNRKTKKPKTGSQTKDEHLANPLDPSNLVSPDQDLYEVASNSSESRSIPTQPTEETTDEVIPPLTRLSTSSVQSLEFQADFEMCKEIDSFEDQQDYDDESKKIDDKKDGQT